MLSITLYEAIFYTFNTYGSRALNVHLFHNSQDYNKIQVRVDNKQMWDELKTESVIKNCLLGGVPIEKAVEKGSFVRCGKLGREKDLPNEKDTWVSRILKGSAVTSLER